MLLNISITNYILLSNISIMCVTSNEPKISAIQDVSVVTIAGGWNLTQTILHKNPPQEKTTSY